MTEASLLADLEAGKTPTGIVSWVHDSASVLALQELAQVHKITKAFALLVTEPLEGSKDDRMFVVR